MRASTSRTTRTLWLSLLAGALAAAIWAAGLFGGIPSSSSLSQHPDAGMQIADPGGGGTTG